MKPADLDKFNRAVSLAQSGQREQAHLWLTELAGVYSEDSSVLLWFAYTADNPSLARMALDKVAAIDPGNPSLQAALDWLSTRVSQPAVTGSFYAPTGSEIGLGYSKTLPGQKDDAPELLQAKPARKSKTLFLALILLGLVLAGTAAFVALNNRNAAANDKLANRGLPVYGGATRLELSESDRNTLLENISKSPQSGRITNLEIEFYSIGRADNTKALDFYDAELKKMGWTAAPTNNSGAALYVLNGYKKGTQNFFVLVLPQNSANPFTFLQGKVKPGSGVLVAFLGDTSTTP